MPQPLLTPREALQRHLEWWSHRTHALLGAFVLCHFVYRYACFFGFVCDWSYRFTVNSDGTPLQPQDQDQDIMGFSTPVASGQLWWYWCAWLGPHVLLQLSGLTFALPSNKRHPDGNRIWDEYRWHALLYMMRCVAFVILASAPLKQRQILGTMVFFANMLCVDGVTRVFHTTTTTKTSVGTIRGLRAPPSLQYIFSVAQFYANVHCLWAFSMTPSTTTSPSVPFASLVVVQSSAFGMTLRRKGLLSHNLGLMLYATVLGLGLCVILQDWERHERLWVGVTLANVAALLRINRNWNKYILWGMYVLVLLPLLEQDQGRRIRDFANVWNVACGTSLLLIVIMACSRSRSFSTATTATTSKEKKMS